MVSVINSIRKYFNEPPNLDEIFKKLKSNMNKKNNRGVKANQSGGDQISPTFLISLIVVGLVIIWGLAGITIIAPAEKGVVLRFGKYNRTLEPGPHWVPPIIESAQIVNVMRDYTFSSKAEMLTKDKNIVDVEVSVVFRIENPEKYLFNAVDPYESVNQATASALRQVVGSTTLDGILTQSRSRARDLIEKQIKETVNYYNVGINIVDVNLQPAKPPIQVSEAFDDVIKALEDEKRFINEAKAYREKVVPIASGKAKRIIQQSQGYQQQVVLDASAQVASFLAIQPQYQINPDIVGNNIYYSKLQDLYSRVNKLFVDIPNNQNAFMYLPIDQMLKAMPVKDDTYMPFTSESQMQQANIATLKSLKPETKGRRSER